MSNQGIVDISLRLGMIVIPVFPFLKKICIGEKMFVRLKGCAACLGADRLESDFLIRSIHSDFVFDAGGKCYTSRRDVKNVFVQNACVLMFKFLFHGVLRPSLQRSG